MPRRNRIARCVAGGLLLAVCIAVAGVSATAATADSDELRVCADPNNLPFSNAEGEGFENKLAELVARDLGKKLTYTWWAQRRGFVRNTLKAGKCDVVMGVPQMEMLSVTRAYYRSTYVFVSRKDRNLDFSSIKAPELRHLRIGVHLIGDDGANTPPAHVLGQEGIVDNVVGYTIYGDYRQDSPPERLVEAVEKGEIDIAAVWGPFAGYAAKTSPVPLRIVPITDTTDFLPFVFQFPIGMGVRRGDEILRGQLNEVISKERDAIRALLDSYGIPQV